MNVNIVEQAKDLQVVIECKQINEQVTRLKAHIELFDNKIQAKHENLVWMRNGIAVGVSKVLILWLIFGNMYGVESIAIEKLNNMVFFVIGGVFIFSVFFTRVIIRKWSFLVRLTCFIVAACIYECAVFYGTGFWSRSGSAIEWMLFVVPVLISYFACILIYRGYSKKKGDIYTEALQKYQQERTSENK